MKKKRRLNRWVLVSLIILAILALLGVSFMTLMANPKYVISESIVRTFKNLEKIENNNGEATLQFGTTITLGGNILGDSLANNTFKISGFIDDENSTYQINASVLENNKKILNGTYSYIQGKNYVASDNLFTNVYNIDEYDCTNKNDLICFLQVKEDEVKNSLDFDTKNISLDKAMTSLENALKDSINNNNTYRNKGSFKDELKDYNKYTYKLDKDTVNDIYSKLDDSAKYYLYDITCLVTEDCDDLAIGKEKIEEKIRDWTEVLEINIYTDGLFNQFKALEIGNNSTFINLYYNKDTKKVNVSLPEQKIKVEIASTDDKQVITIYYKEVLIGTLDYERKEKEKVLNYKFNFLGFSLTGIVSNKFNSHGDYMDGVLDANTSLDALIFKTDLDINVDYNLASKITMSLLDTTGALDYNAMTEEDKSQMAKEIENFKKSDIGKIFGLLDDEEITDNLMNSEI